MAIRPNLRAEPDPRLRQRVERLLRPEFHVDDITKLFLGLREHHGDNPTFQEVGDFIAHGDMRIKGAVSSNLTDLITFYQNRFPRSIKEGVNIDAGRLLGVLKANLRLIQKSAAMMRALKLDGSAYSILCQAGEKLKGVVRDKIIADPPLNLPQFHVVHQLYDYMLETPLFWGRELVEEFMAVLLRNKLVTPAEAPQFWRYANEICLVAVAAMHGCRIRVGDDGGYISLRAGSSRHYAGLTVTGAFEMGGFLGIRTMATRIFETQVATAHCGNNLGALPDWFLFHEEELLEVQDDGRLYSVAPPTQFPLTLIEPPEALAQGPQH